MRVFAFLAVLWASALAQVDEGRLPPHAIPTNYVVDSIIVLEPDFNFEGTFAIDIDVTQDSTFDGTIYFHATRLSIDESTVTLVDQSSGDSYTVRIVSSIYKIQTNIYVYLVIELQITSIDYDNTWDFVIVSYDNPSSDHSVTLSGSYSGDLASQVAYTVGLFLDSYQDFASGEVRYCTMFLLLKNLKSKCYIVRIAFMQICCWD